MALVDFAKIREEYVCTEVSFRWWNQTRAAGGTVRRQMVEAIGGEESSYGATKKLYLSSRPSIQAVNAVRAEIERWWEGRTVPYQDGRRLLRRENLESFQKHLLSEMAGKLAGEAVRVQWDRDAIMADARERLGEGYDAGDYSADLSGLFGVSLAFPALEPDGELPRRLRPAA